MSGESERPLRDWTVSHIIGFLGLLGAGVGSWVVLNSRVSSVETALENKEVVDNIYRAEQIRRSERLEDKLDRLLMANGIKPEQ